LDLIVDADKVCKFYNIPLTKHFDEYPFLHKGYSFCNPLDYTFYTFEEHPCSEDYFKVKKLFDESQKIAVKNALSANLVLIQGPPGTGKSHVAVRIIDVLLNLTKQPIIILASN
jgi:chromosomal replication initiation ATPase DnaA